jgi:endonuclease/exonuclease/phosphatase (EEP) superfamily protein YafD
LAGLGARAHWLLDLFTHFPLHYLLVLAPVSLLLWVMRRRAAAAFCTTCALYNAFLLAPLFRAPPVAGPPPDAALRVMEINLLRENGHSNEALRVIGEADADIVVALELTPAWLERLAPLRAKYPHVAAEPQEDCFGLAVFSRHPITDTRVLWLGYGFVPTLRMTLDVNGRAIDLIATHPPPPKDGEYSDVRNEQLRDLAREAATRKHPQLIVGDLNATPWTPHFRGLIREGHLHDSGRGAGLGGTWPSFAPSWLRIPIDHVLMSPELRVVSRRVGRPFGSDHVPLVVEVGFAREAAPAPRL